MQRPDPNDRVLNGADTPDGEGACVLIGRPPIGPRISFCVTPEELAQVESLAKDAGWSRAHALRYLMRWGLVMVLRPPQEYAGLRAAVEAQAAAQGISPAELLGSAWAGVARQGGGK